HAEVFFLPKKGWGMTAEALHFVSMDFRALSDLVPFEKNSRTHSPEQVAGMAGSIDELGMSGPLVVRNGTIAKGHGTLQAVRILYEQGKTVHLVPGRFADPPAPAFPPGTVPVIDASGWSEEQF